MSVLLRLALALTCLHLSHQTCTNFPIRLPGEQLTLPDSNQRSCPTDAERQAMLDQLNEELDKVIEAQQHLLQDLSSPMECPGSGWIRVVDFNMLRDGTTECLGEKWTTGESSPDNPFCRPSQQQTCQSVNISTNSVSYREVCGRVKGYQIGPANSFLPYTDNPSIDATYLDGVSITRGTPRAHIWSFAAGGGPGISQQCPCSNSNSTTPSFVGENYFCDVAAPNGTAMFRDIFDNHPLWDGEGCDQHNMGCCERGRYFYASLDQRSCEPLEVRLCASANPTGVGAGVNVIELYVR